MGYLRDRVRGCRIAAAVADHGGGETSLRGMVMSLGGEIATPTERGAVRSDRGRDRAAGGDSRPASSRGPGAPAGRSDREDRRFSSRALACGRRRRAPRRSHGSSPSQAGHPARAARAPGVRAGWRAALPGRARTIGPSSRATAVAPPLRGSRRADRAAGRRKAFPRLALR